MDFAFPIKTSASKPSDSRVGSESVLGVCTWYTEVDLQRHGYLGDPSSSYLHL